MPQTETQDWDAISTALLAESDRWGRAADVLQIGVPLACLCAMPWLGWLALAGVVVGCLAGHVLHRRSMAPLVECERVLDAEWDRLMSALAATEPTP